MNSKFVLTFAAALSLAGACSTGAFAQANGTWQPAQCSPGTAGFVTVPAPEGFGGGREAIELKCNGTGTAGAIVTMPPTSASNTFDWRNMEVRFKATLRAPAKVTERFCFVNSSGSTTSFTKTLNTNNGARVDAHGFRVQGLTFRDFAGLRGRHLFRVTFAFEGGGEGEVIIGDLRSGYGDRFTAEFPTDTINSELNCDALNGCSP